MGGRFGVSRWDRVDDEDAWVDGGLWRCWVDRDDDEKMVMKDGR